MALDIKLNNVEVILSNIKGIQNKVESALQKELDNFGLSTVNDAKRNAPVDEGVLRNAIGYTKEKLKVTITVNVDYAAYVEFGTRKFAAAYVSSLPKDWQTFAATFKGPGGGSMEEFVMRLVDWVKRKGIAGVYSVQSKKRKGTVVKNQGTVRQGQALEDYEAAYGIALHILREGIKPQPFLYPAYQKNVIELVNNIKAALN